MQRGVRRPWVTQMTECETGSRMPLRHGVKMLESQLANFSWVKALSIRKSAMKFWDALEYLKYRWSSNASPLAIFSPAGRSSLIMVWNVN